MKAHSFPATIVIRNLPDRIDEAQFKTFLGKNKILIPAVIHRGEAVFKVSTLEIGESFLELVGHKFNGVAYKLEIHDKNYKTIEKE